MASQNEQRAIEQEFAASWDKIEEFYTYNCLDLRKDWLKPIFDVISELRARGYDKKLRAGQGMLRFQLSRSLQHGLRLEQAMLGFDINPTGGMTVVYFEESRMTEIALEDVKITAEVEGFLARLLAHPID